MLSKKSGQTIFQQLCNLCNGSISPNNISALSDIELHSVGISNAKVPYIRSLTDVMQSFKIDLSLFPSMPELDSKNVFDVYAKPNEHTSSGRWSFFTII